MRCAFCPGCLCKRNSRVASFGKYRPARCQGKYHFCAADLALQPGLMMPAEPDRLVLSILLDRPAILSPRRSRQILRAGILHSTCSQGDVEPDTTCREAARRPGNIRGRDTPFPPVRF